MPTPPAEETSPMPRKTTPRRRTALAATAAAPLLLGLWAAGPAGAHGAPTDPVSRVYACSPEGGAAARSAACRAAVAANGGAPFTAWDNLRVADVGGRDRRVIPDGELCSGGLAAYRGLNLARTDWPSTRLTPGATVTLRYASTIPHTGTFRLYLTKPGYDPSRPLTWSDLPERPLAEVTDPPLTDGAYHIPVRLPADRTGRHVLYTVWQNSSTPDTYYSCSDVVLAGGGQARPEPSQAAPAAGPKPSGTAPAGPKPSATAPAGTAPASTPAAGTTPAPTAVVGAARTAADTGGASSAPGAPLLAGGAAAVLLLTGGAALAVRLRRR
ncbi:lytic polysaccharide monooxygenase [Streptomyces griseosporeus]|uniref:lytic polysaccharide monooxygenase n=1 Tax=Streptomyces griseosporeus TaxID=1910 RepID=UPI0036FE7194